MNKEEIEKIVSLISDGGLFSQQLEGFETRLQQQEMLRDVLEAYQEGKIATIEAATGTGKSLAYLLGALFSKERTVIATHTIALQEQLIKKDIPTICKILGLNVKVVLAKGMHNYLCLRKLEDIEVEKRFLSDKQGAEIQKIEAFSKCGKEATRSDLPFVVSSETWEKVAAEGESCTHMKCPHYKNCFFFKARKEAEEAQVIVANHHLLFADLSRRSESNNYNATCILPLYTHLILDEAHHIEDVAKEHFAKKVSRKGLGRLLNRLSPERSVGKLRALHQKLCDLVPENKRDKNLLTLLSQLELDLPFEKRKIMEALETLFSTVEMAFAIQEKLRILESHLKHPLWIESFQKKVGEFSFLLRKFLEGLSNALAKIAEDEFLKSRTEGLVADIQGIVFRLNVALETLVEFAFSPLKKEEVRWIEAGGTLVRGEIDISTLLKESLFEKMETVVLCSATLATRDNFSFIHSTLGISKATGKIYPSPFDYEKNAMLLVPLDMPHPDTLEFMEKAIVKIEEAVQASCGNAFVLFTSYNALRFAEERLSGIFQRNGYPLLCQGQEASMALLNRFKKEKGSILFGTDSFWEGVDVVGDALQCVIIVKLPFIVPSDPFFQAKSEWMKEAGQSPFFDYSLPHAAMKFKQGFGRLIRSKNDRGCVVCLDSRLATKGYGKVFINTLPNCPKVFARGDQVIEEMKKFYQ